MVYTTPILALFLSCLAPLTVAISVQDAISARSELSTLSSLLTLNPSLLTNLTAAGGTFLAPTNDAFSKFLSGAPVSSVPQSTIQDIIRYHILPLALKSTDLSVEGGAIATTSLMDSAFANLQGSPNVVYASSFGSTGQESAPSGLKIYSGVGLAANVTASDIAFDNGFLHLIDSVFNLPQPCTKTAESASLSSLLSALKSTNLTNFVDTTPKFTCFAPSDAAFQAAGIDVTKLTNDQLTNTLKYHSIVGDVGYTTSFQDATQYQTLLGVPVTVHKRNGTIFINDVAVQVGNVIMSNGVAHVLGGVLSPPTNATTPTASTVTKTVVTGVTTAPASSSSTSSAGTSLRLFTTPGMIGTVAVTVMSAAAGLLICLI